MDILIGDKFYFNSYCVMKHFSLPDYLIISGISKDGKYVTGQYENHAVDTRPRLFSIDNLKFDSNLNPKRENPSWIFLKAICEEENANE